MSDHLDPEELLRIAVEAASEAGRLLAASVRLLFIASTMLAWSRLSLAPSEFPLATYRRPVAGS